MKQASKELRALIAPVVQGLGYELVGVEFSSQGRQGLLRIYIDAPGGVSVDDCGRVSHQVSGVLDVEDPIRGQYTLEVSSPGLDRPLFNAEQFRRYLGHRVRLSLAAPLEGRRRFVGRLRAVHGDRVVLDYDGHTLDVSLDEIERANLVPEL